MILILKEINKRYVNPYLSHQRVLSELFKPQFHLLAQRTTIFLVLKQNVVKNYVFDKSHIINFISYKIIGY